MYPCSSSELGGTGYKSCYLTWYSNDNEDMGFYVEPFSYCQENSSYTSAFHYYRDGEDDITEHDPPYQDLTPSHYAPESAILLGDYFSHFVWDEYTVPEGYDAFSDRFNGMEMVKDSSDLVRWNESKFSEGSDRLDMVTDPYRHKKLYETYQCSDKERETQFEVEHVPWYNCDFGFQYRVDEDYGAAEFKSKYSQSWESWDEMGLYEKIFGDWHDMLRSDNESRAEAGHA